MTDAQKEKNRAYFRSYRANHREAICLREKRWRQTHRGAVRLYRKKWMAKDANREHHRLYQKQWRKDNYDKARAIEKRSRAKKRLLGGRFLCVECGQRFSPEAAESGGFRRIGRRIGICRECYSGPVERWCHDDAIRPEEIPQAASTSLWMTIPETKLRELM